MVVSCSGLADLSFGLLCLLLARCTSVEVGLSGVGESEMRLALLASRPVRPVIYFANYTVNT